jgi:hypothetical protein
MSPTRSSLQIAPELVWRILEDGNVLLSPFVGEVYILQQMDTIIWQCLVEQKSITEIETMLSQRYHISAEQAHTHLQVFLTGLTRRGVLVWASSST